MGKVQFNKKKIEILWGLTFGKIIRQRPKATKFIIKNIFKRRKFVKIEIEQNGAIHILQF
jgi:hypothetical protein